MNRDLTSEELERITQAILGGDRIEAINIYISITGCGLTEAQAFISALTAEVKLTEQVKKHIAKQQSRPDFWQRLIFSVKK